MTKREARAAARARWAALSPADLADLGRAMARQLLRLPAWEQAATVFCFASLPQEPDTAPILQATLAAGKRLCLPRVLPGGGLAAVPVTDLDALVPGTYGIREPEGPGLTAAQLGPDTLALVPCLAADRRGVRLGRGGGYYDRFLAGYAGARLLLCPRALVFDRLPCDAWDIPFAPHTILTETGLLEPPPCTFTGKEELT